MPIKSTPLLEKVFTLLKSSIFIAKMRRKIIPRILFLKRSKKVKKLMFRKHYNYRYYIQEYEFSPSKNTPLMQYYYRKPIKKRSCYQDMYSMLFVCKCLGMLRYEDEDEDRRRSYSSMDLVALPSNEDIEELYEVSNLFCSEDDDDDDECVDEKAEKFIEKFYEDMRRERQEAIMFC